MPVPGLSLLGLKRIRGFVSILRYINPTIIIISWSRFCTVNCRPLVRNFQLPLTSEVGGTCLTTMGPYTHNREQVTLFCHYFWNCETNKSCVSLERSVYISSARFYCIDIHADMVVKSQVWAWCAEIHWSPCRYEPFWHSFFEYELILFLIHI